MTTLFKKALPTFIGNSLEEIENIDIESLKDKLTKIPENITDIHKINSSDFDLIHIQFVFESKIKFLSSFEETKHAANRKVTAWNSLIDLINEIEISEGEIKVMLNGLI